MKLVIFTLLITLAVSEINQCIQDLTKISSQLLNFTGTDPYSLMALNSGRHPSDLGNYDNCANLDYADYILVRIFPNAAIYIGICSSKNCTVSDYNQISQMYIHNSTQLKSSPYNPMKDPAYIQSFPPSKLYRDYINTLDNGYELIYPQSYIQDHFNQLSDGAIAMLVVCSILVVCMIIGTVLDFLSGGQEKASIAGQKYSDMDFITAFVVRKKLGIVIRIFLCFSLYTNAKKLFVSRCYEKTGEYCNLEMFNGVRVMTMGWVILGNVFLTKLGYTSLVNPTDVKNWYKETKGAMIYGSFYSVDAFFWLSGFLLTYLFLTEYNSKGKIHWRSIFFHRFYRILPTYMFSLFLIWAFLKYIGNGPLWFDGDIINEDCYDYWWTNLIFLNNFIPDGDGSRCMAWSWYLANDMQFFLITPIILYVYHKFSKLAGWLILFGLLIIHIVSSAMISDYYNLALISNRGHIYDRIYIKLYCRVGAYAIGIMFGLIYFSYKHYEKRFHIYDPFAFYLSSLLNKRLIRYILYAIGLFLINFVIFIQRSAYRSAYDSLDFEDDWTQEERNAFYALNRIGFALGLGMILLPILMGYNKTAYRILGHGMWTPLSRLSFSCYCVHYGITYAILMSQKTSDYLSDTTMLYDFIICLMASYAVAFPVSMLVEVPAQNLEKVFRSKPTKLNLKRPDSSDVNLSILR